MTVMLPDSSCLVYWFMCNTSAIISAENVGSQPYLAVFFTIAIIRPKLLSSHPEFKKKRLGGLCQQRCADLEIFSPCHTRVFELFADMDIMRILHLLFLCRCACTAQH